jgi:hypothetical protein
MSNQEIFPVLVGIGGFHWVRGAAKECLPYYNKICEIADAENDNTLKTIAYALTGAVSVDLGDTARAIELLHKAVDLHDPDQQALVRAIYGQDNGVPARCWLAWSNVMCGRTEAGRRWAEESVKISREIDHPFTTGLALATTSLAYALIPDVEMAMDRAQECVQYCNSQNVPYWFQPV